MPELNPILKSYYLLRYFGPRVLRLRAGVYLDKWRGTTAKTYAHRPWESIELAQIVSPGVPTEPQAYAAFKREQKIAFLFPLGKPPEIPQSIRNAFSPVACDGAAASHATP